MFYPPQRAWRGYPKIRVKSQKHTPDAGERAFQPRKPVMKTRCILTRKTKNRKRKKPNVKNTSIMRGSLGGPAANRAGTHEQKSAFLCDRAPRCRTGRPMYDLDNKTEGFCNKKNQKKTCEKVKLLETQGNMPKWPKVVIFTRQNEWQQGYNNKQYPLRPHRFARGLLQVKTENINFVK